MDEALRAIAETPLPPRQLALKPKRLYGLKPRAEWVLVRKLTLDEEVTEAGIILNKEQLKLLKGEVVAFGSKVKGLKVGQEVVYSAFSMAIGDIEELTGDRNLVMVRDEEIYCGLELLEDQCT
jgi:co-chaperonin GroES (HSP10)